MLNVTAVVSLTTQTTRSHTRTTERRTRGHVVVAAALLCDVSDDHLQLSSVRTVRAVRANTERDVRVRFHAGGSRKRIR